MNNIQVINLLFLLLMLPLTSFITLVEKLNIKIKLILKQSGANEYIELYFAILFMVLVSVAIGLEQNFEKYLIFSYVVYLFKDLVNYSCHLMKVTDIVLKIVATMFLLSVLLDKTLQTYHSLLILLGIMMLNISDNRTMEKKKNEQFVTTLANQIVSLTILFYLFNKAKYIDGEFSVILGFLVLGVLHTLTSYLYKYTFGHVSTFRFWVMFSFICGVLSYVL